MAIIKLEFVSPIILDNLKYGQTVSKVLWTYEDLPESELYIDTDSWRIECKENGKEGKITEWEVNLNAYKMKLKDGVEYEGFVDMNYPFSVSMLGQLVDARDLVDFLKSLQLSFGLEAPQFPDKETTFNN